MNTYITTQITNMQIMLKTFEQSCKMAAMQDDGKISRDEEKKLKRIHEATTRYKEELELYK